ncbi:hypothetical protein [Phytoactinopolyspora endophytica]|uniref:hypothetical protein n=1 Tax=Phytoactinopolyspora endophytica TaxID=1642495 RepID=UPI00101DA4E7|nr:hypothetical protein [Phytoactinopolyspora endophytica]
MSWAAAAAERIAVLVVGLVLVALGAAAAAWQQGWLPDVADRLDVQTAVEWTGESWWPWAVGGAGVVLVILGLLWVAAHARLRTVGRMRLDGSGRSGRLTVDGSALMSPVVLDLEATPGVRDASGRVLSERKESVIELRVKVDPGADLDEVADATERASVQLGRLLRADPASDAGVTFRAVLTGGGSRSKMSRVR